MCEILKRTTFGIPSKTSVWKHLAGKHSWLQIVGRDNLIHKGMRTCTVQTQSISLEEIHNSTWRGRRFWAVDSIMQRIHTFSSTATIQNFCSNPWRNNYWTSHWSYLNSMDLTLQFHQPMIMGGHLMLWFPEGRVGSWRKFTFPMPYSDPVRNCSLTFENQKEEGLAKNRPILASRTLVKPMFQVFLAAMTLVQTLSAFLLHMRRFTQNEPFLRTTGCGRLFMPRLQTEETWQ